MITKNYLMTLVIFRMDDAIIRHISKIICVYPIILSQLKRQKKKRLKIMLVQHLVRILIFKFIMRNNTLIIKSIIVNFLLCGLLGQKY